MQKRFIYTAFVLLLSFPHLLFALPSNKVAGNGPDVAGTNKLWVNKTKLNNAFTPQPITICSGASIVIKGDIQTTVPDSFLWQVLQGSTWVAAPGINNTADYPPSLLVNTTSGNLIYDIRRMTITAGVTAYDSFYDVTVLTTAPIANDSISAPSVSSYCSVANSPLITGSTPTGGIGGLIYQWQSSTDNVNFTDINGANSINYSPAQVTATTYFRRIVIGNCTLPSVSNSVSITIITALANNTINSPAVTSFCASGTPAIITGNTPSGGSGVYTYQWQSSTDAINFADIAGATSSSYNPPSISITTFYRRVVTSGVCSVPNYSNVAIINILPAVSNNVITPPAVTNFCVVGSPSAILGSTPTGGNGGYTYQWQFSTDNLNFTDIPGATSADFAPPVLIATSYLRRIVLSGSCLVPLTSNVVTLTILPIPATPLFSQSAIPTCTGSVVTVPITNPQAGVVYNWYDSPAKTNLLYTGTTYTTAPLTTNIILYVESFNGTCSSTTLATVLVNLAPPPTAPSLVADTVKTCNGSSATLSVSNPQPGFTYNWYSSPNGGSSVFSGAVFTTPALFTNAVYYVDATNAGSCTSTTRTAVYVMIPPADQFSTQDASVCPGSSATLTASSSSANVIINWYAAATGGTPLFTGTAFTTPVLNIDASYYAEATNTVTGCVSSRQLAQVHILQPLPAPVVSTGTITDNSITFNWSPIAGATGYKVSIDNGLTFSDPSTGSTGLSHTVSGLQINQSVTILVMTLGGSSCQVSAVSGAVTATVPNQVDLIYVPNAFTPNGDGKNDMVHVHSEGIKTMKFSIYDQWGEMIFSTSNLTDGWDGTFKGTKEPVGVYVYYVSAVMNNGQQVSKRGTITLLR